MVNLVKVLCYLTVIIGEILQCPEMKETNVENLVLCYHSETLMEFHPCQELMNFVEDLFQILI